VREITLVSGWAALLNCGASRKRSLRFSRRSSAWLGPTVLTSLSLTFLGAEGRR
jgi:hypothetical protein